MAWGPFDTRMPLGTVGLVRLPIQDEGLQVIAVFNLVLPAIGSKGGPNHINLVLLRGHQEVGIHIAAVEQVGAQGAGLVRPNPGRWAVPSYNRAWLTGS